MVKPPTEYRRSFRANDADLTESWEASLDYRIRRRHDEQNHRPDPFTWPRQILAWEDDSDSSIDTDRRPNKNIPKHVFKHVKFNEAYNRKRQAIINTQEKLYQPSKYQEEQTSSSSSSSENVSFKDTIKVQTNGAKSRNKNVAKRKSQVTTAQHTAIVRDRGAQTPEWDKEEMPAAHRVFIDTPVQVNLNGKGDELREQSQKPIKPKRPQKPTGKTQSQRIAELKPRPMSAPLGRSSIKVKTQASTDLDNRPPFLAYGYKNKDRAVGTKRTHNINAQDEVFPAALRAFRRQHNQVKQIESENKEAPYYERRSKALFNDQYPYNINNYETEYRRKFIGHEGEYERNLYRRNDPRSTWRELYVTDHVY